LIFLYVQFVTLIVFLNADKFLTALSTPGRDVLQGAVIVGQHFQYLPLLKTPEPFARLQKMKGTHATYQVQRII
jgi:hypothetical protein